MIYTETPTNPTLALTDLRATAAIAHGAGALAIIDNTFAAPYNQRPIDRVTSKPSPAAVSIDWALYSADALGRTAA
jgi:hypothetical protein